MAHFAESARGIAPRAAHRTGREPLDSSGSCHRLKAAASRQDRSVPPVAGGPIDPDAGDLPPWLHGNYPASPLLRSSPPLAVASVLSASRCFRLCFFPYHRQPGSQVPYESPDEIHAAYTPDTAWPVSRFPPCFSQGRLAPRFRCHLTAFDASSAVRLHSSLSSPHDVIAMSRLLTITYTTAALRP